MLEMRHVLSGRDVSVTLADCSGRHAGWSSEESVDEFSLVLVRSGEFRRRVDGVEILAQPLLGYLERPGSAHQVAHPAGGDTCTLIGLTGDTIDSMGDLSKLPAGLPIHIDTASDFGHRLLLRCVRDGADRNEIEERALTLAGRALSLSATQNDGAVVSASSRRIADQVREALSGEPDLDLYDLARLVGRSIYRVSRAFRSATGLTISQYRLRVRARQALELEGGESNLARVAAECGSQIRPT